MNKNQEQLNTNGMITAIEQLIDYYTVPCINKEDKAKTEEILLDLKSKISTPLNSDSVKDIYILNRSEFESLCGVIIRKIDRALEMLQQ